jgi:feruloyl esterase
MTGFATGYFRDMVYDDANLNLLTLDADAAFDLAVKKTAADLDSSNPDLSAFSGRGGKLILYHGWNDPAIPALGTIDYYQRVAETLGKEKTESFARLFLVPGMQHCDGGPGITSFGQWGPSPKASADTPETSVYGALESWVETGKAPGQIIASKAPPKAGTKTPSVTRPICAYPSVAIYSGTGAWSKASSWTCSTAK